MAGAVGICIYHSSTNLLHVRYRLYGITYSTYLCRLRSRHCCRSKWLQVELSRGRNPSFHQPFHAGYAHSYVRRLAYRFLDSRRRCASYDLLWLNDLKAWHIPVCRLFNLLYRISCNRFILDYCRHHRNCSCWCWNGSWH